MDKIGDNKKVVSVVGAVIIDGNKFLLAQRKSNDSFGSMWEFPGGKVEEGEDKISALKREIYEELGVDIKVDRFLYNFEDEIPELKIVVYLFQCRIVDGSPRCIECQDFVWADLSGIEKLNLAPADRKIFQFLKKTF